MSQEDIPSASPPPTDIVPFSYSWIASTIMTITTRVVSLSVGVVAIVVGILYVKQDSLLYHPVVPGLPRSPRDNPKGYRSPEERLLPFETHEIETEDGIKLHSWLILANNPETPPSIKPPTVLFFHGNAGNIGVRIPNAMQMKQQLDANIWLIEYRGFGDSQGHPDEMGLKLDAEAVINYAQKPHAHINPKRIYVFGRSLGGAVAFHLGSYAQKQGLPLAGMVVENTFTSIAGMVDVLLPYIAPLKGLVLRIGWNSLQIAPTLKNLPTLYLAGARDELVPHAHMQQLYQTQRKHSVTPANVKIHVIPDGTHNESWLKGGKPYWDAFRSFLNSQSSCSSTASDSFTGGEAASIPTMSSNLLDVATGASMAANEKEKESKKIN